TILLKKLRFFSKIYLTSSPGHPAEADIEKDKLNIDIAGKGECHPVGIIDVDGGSWFGFQGRAEFILTVLIEMEGYGVFVFKKKEFLAINKIARRIGPRF